MIVPGSTAAGCGKPHFLPSTQEAPVCHPTTGAEHSGQSHSSSQSRMKLPGNCTACPPKNSTAFKPPPPPLTDQCVHLARPLQGFREKGRIGRGRVEIKRIANDVSRRATFGKRSGGLLKKAQELAVLCDADLGVLIFDGAGRQMDYCSPHTSWTELIQRYDITNDQLQGNEGMNHDDDQLLAEIARLRRERDRLEASVRRQIGEDLPSTATAGLGDLEQQQERALGKVREMKEKLLEQQLDESYHRVHILEDQNSFLRHMMSEEGRQRAAVEASAVVAELMTPVPPGTLFGGFFPEVEEEEAATSLRL